MNVRLFSTCLFASVRTCADYTSTAADCLTPALVRSCMHIFGVMLSSDCRFGRKCGVQATLHEIYPPTRANQVWVDDFSARMPKRFGPRLEEQANIALQVSATEKLQCH